MTTRKCMKERIEEYKKEFSGEGMDRDVVMFKEKANRIKRAKDLEQTPSPPDAETIIKEIHKGMRPRKSKE